LQGCKLARKLGEGMSKIVLITPNYYDDIFSKSKVRAAISRGTVPLGLACIAAPLLGAGHKVKILDLNLCHDPNSHFLAALKEFSPDVVGITSTTPLIHKVYEL